MYFHVWFVTKYRKTTLEGETDHRIKAVFEECIKRHGYKVLEFETNRDHMHVLIEVNNKQDLSEAIRTLKSVSAKEIHHTQRRSLDFARDSCSTDHEPVEGRVGNDNA